MSDAPTNRSIARTEGICVETQSFYVAERSDPSRGFYFFAYRIRITNEGAQPAQLLSRHWIIHDGKGRVEEVRGDGVVGEQPLLGPGDSHEYTSFCPLPTPWGSMEGSYLFRRPDDSNFTAQIARFQLVQEQMLN